MAGGTKPDTKVLLKNKSTGKTIQLAAYWTHDGPMPSGGLDRSIKRIRIEYEDRDGVTHTETIDNRVKETATHYCNLFVVKDDAPARAPAKAPARKPAADLPPDDMADDDIPF